MLVGEIMHELYPQLRQRAIAAAIDGYGECAIEHPMVTATAVMEIYSEGFKAGFEEGIRLASEICDAVAERAGAAKH